MRNPPHVRLVLASASPARLRTLRSAGIEAEVMVSGIDECAVIADRPDTLCATLARMKAVAVADRLRGRATTPGAHDTLVLGCDSVLAFDGEILGKPADPAEAVQRWLRMRGRSGVLYTGHCLVEVQATGRPAGGPGGSTALLTVLDGARLAEGIGETTVHFADVTDAEINAYVATGEPMRVAGAFTIDGIGGPFVEGIDGDPGTVVGLSLPLLRHLLTRLGVQIHDLWRTTVRQSAEPMPGA